MLEGAEEQLDGNDAAPVEDDRGVLGFSGRVQCLGEHARRER